MVAARREWTDLGIEDRDFALEAARPKRWIPIGVEHGLWCRKTPVVSRLRLHQEPKPCRPCRAMRIELTTAGPRVASSTSVSERAVADYRRAWANIQKAKGGAA